MSDLGSSGMKLTVGSEGIELDHIRWMADLMAFTRSITRAAQIRKTSYDAHIKAGFTEEQALKLCKE